MMTKEFLAKEAHFDALVGQLSDKTKALFDSMKHTRAESCFRGRSLIVYQMDGRVPLVLDQIEVMDFVLDDKDGASTELRSKVSGKRVQVSYSPTPVFDHPFLVYLPLYSRARWCAPEDMVGKGGSLAFDMVFRTQSRRHLRERDVIYCETGPNWAKEFPEVAAQKPATVE